MGLYERLSGLTAEEVVAPAATQTATAVKPKDLKPTHAHSGVPDRLVQLRRRTHLALVRALGPRLYDTNTSQTQLEDAVRTKLSEVLATESEPMSAADRKQLIADIIDDILGYGPLEPLLHDPTITEIMANGPDMVYIERDGRIELTEVTFLDEGHLRRVMEKIVGEVGRRLDEAQPYVDARLPDGSRVNAVIPPVAIDGPTLTIRKFSAEAFTAQDLVAYGTWSTRVAQFLAAAVEGRTNILVSGGTGAGKTTTLNVLSNFIPSAERIVTVEDAAELRLMQPHVVRMEYRPPNIESRGEITIRDLVRNSLRMRPDRIVVGEVRGGEALDMLQAMNTGHDGSIFNVDPQFPPKAGPHVVGEVRGGEALDMLQAMNTGHDGSISTVHSNSPRDALARIETMVLMAGVDLPIRAIREQVAAAIQLIVHQTRMKDGSRRISHVTEITGMEGDTITVQDIYLFDHGMGFDADTGRSLGHLKPTGIRPRVTDDLADLGVAVDNAWFEPEQFSRRDGAK